MDGKTPINLLLWIMVGATLGFILWSTVGTYASLRKRKR